MRKTSEDQLRAFGNQLKADRESSDLSAHAVSELMDPTYRKSGSTIRNYENGNVSPGSAFVVLALERALKRPRGTYLKLLGWPIPKGDAPAVMRPSQDELVEHRVARMEQELAELRGVLREVLRAVADRVELPPSLLIDDPADR